MWSCKCTGSLEVRDNVVNAASTANAKRGGLILYQYAASIIGGHF